jgi:protein translocase SecG subunit
MNILAIIQIVIGILLVASILLQARGEELGMTFGGAGEVFRTKRGIEKVLFFSTIVLAIAFFALAFVQMIK